MITSFGKQLKMKDYKRFLFLLLMIMDVSTKAQEVTCEGEQLVNVYILTGHPDIVSPYKPGHILVFQCTDVNLKMNGQQTIECLSNGKWDYPYPRCDVTCHLNTTENNIKMERFPDLEGPVKPGYNLTFSCNEQGLILKGQREITCQSNGEWSSPFPKCEEITCELKSTTFGVRKINPEGKTIFRAGERVEITCSEKYWFFGTKETTKSFACQYNGQWDSEPVCQEITCEFPHDQHVYYPYYYFRGDMKLGTKKLYKCESGYDTMAEEATCTEDGWTPNPLCAKMCAAPNIPNAEIVEGKTRTSKYQIYSKIKYQCRPGFEPEKPIEITCDSWAQWTDIQKCTEKMCATPDIPNAEILGGWRPKYRISSRIEYKCSPGFEPKQRIQITCDSQGQWTGIQQCTVMTGTVKCGPPTNVDNADTKDMTKNEYSTGERVEYICFNKYTLDERPPFSKYLTCQQGQWSGNIKCLKPCTVTVEIMDKRGIELAYADDQKMFATHNDHIIFKCQRGKYSRDTVFRRQCNDGVMTLPLCV